MNAQFAFAALLVCTASAMPLNGYEQDQDCTGQPNLIPVWDQQPRLLRTVPNGKLYEAGFKNETTVFVLHVYGTPYEQGLAHGQLLKEEIHALYSTFHDYFAEQIQAYVKFLPKFLVKILDTHGVNAALDLVRDLTKKYTPKHFDEELEGLAKGADMDYRMVQRVHQFPELIRAACSMMGAWSNATGAQNGAGLIQLRALDWGVDNPFRTQPGMIVYHPSANATDQGHPFAILSWSGFIGAITGYSTKMAISEKKWYKDAPLEILPDGYPWHYMLRDILQFDANLAAAESRIGNAKKTASIFIGLGSREDNRFVAEEYGKHTAVIFNDTSSFPGYAPQVEQHPNIKDVVYIDKHTQPSANWCMARIIQRHYGNIDVAAMIDLVSRFQTGDMQIAVSDFYNDKFVVSVASKDKNQTEAKKAYENGFLSFDMAQQFAEEQ